VLSISFIYAIADMFSVIYEESEDMINSEVDMFVRLMLYVQRLSFEGFLTEGEFRREGDLRERRDEGLKRKIKEICYYQIFKLCRSWLEESLKRSSF